MMVGIFPGGKCLLRISGVEDNIVVTTDSSAGIRIDGNYKQTRPTDSSRRLWGHFEIDFVAANIHKY